MSFLPECFSDANRAVSTEMDNKQQGLLAAFLASSSKRELTYVSDPSGTSQQMLTASFGNGRIACPSTFSYKFHSSIQC